MDKIESLSEEKSKKPKNIIKEYNRNPLIIILLVLIILFMGGLSYLFLNNNIVFVGLENSFVKDVQDQENEGTQNVDEIELVEEDKTDENDEEQSVDEIVIDQTRESGGRNIYNNTRLGLKLTYPGEWEIEEEDYHYLKNLHNHEIKDISLKLTILDEDQDYAFKYDIPFGYGRIFCMFDDSIDIIEGTLQEEYGGYTEYEFEGEEYIYRIADEIGSSKTVCKCKRREGGVGCNNWMNPGYISFTLPNNPDEEKIESLFDILRSTEYTGEEYFGSNEEGSLL